MPFSDSSKKQAKCLGFPSVRLLSLKQRYIPSSSKMVDCTFLESQQSAIFGQPEYICQLICSLLSSASSCATSAFLVSLPPWREPHTDQRRQSAPDAIYCLEIVFAIDTTFVLHPIQIVYVFTSGSTFYFCSSDSKLCVVFVSGSKFYLCFVWFTCLRMVQLFVFLHLVQSCVFVRLVQYFILICV